MKCLIVEDEFASRRLLEVCLSEYADCSVAINGCEAVNGVKHALELGEPYELICMDIKMPQMDGMEAKKAIRKLEHQHGIKGFDGAKIIMATALDDRKNIIGAFKQGCESYIVKPFKEQDIITELQKLGLISQKTGV